VLLHRVATGEVGEILLEGMPLGYSTRAQYERREYELAAGDVVLLMSDGLPERLNAADEELGYPRTQALFGEVAGESPQTICERLAQGGAGWAAGRPLDDDVTFVVVKVK